MNNYNQNNYYPNGYNQNNMNSDGKGLSIACLVCGICSIVTCWCYGIIGIILGVLAIVFYFMLKKKGLPLDGMVKAGFICGIVGSALSLFCLISVIISIIVGNSSLIYRNVYNDLYNGMF